MISDTKICRGDQGMKGIPNGGPLRLNFQLRATLTKEEEPVWKADYDRARRNKVQKGKEKRVQDLLTALNRLSANLFAAISVAERQIAVLQDLHSVFSTSYRTTKEYEKGYRLRQNPFHKNIATIPILSGGSEQIWPNALDTIDGVARVRKRFIKKVKGLVENMDIRRKIV